MRREIDTGWIGDGGGGCVEGWGGSTPRQSPVTGGIQGTTFD
jgi:hypothetical protein